MWLTGADERLIGSENADVIQAGGGAEWTRVEVFGRRDSGVGAAEPDAHDSVLMSAVQSAGARGTAWINPTGGSGPANQSAELVARNLPVELGGHTADVCLDRVPTLS